MRSTGISTRTGRGRPFRTFRARRAFTPTRAENLQFPTSFLEFGQVRERGGFFGHGPSLYQEAVGVPLLLRYPPRIPAGVRVAQPVSTLGVFATLVAYVVVLPAVLAWDDSRRRKRNGSAPAERPAA